MPTLPSHPMHLISHRPPGRRLMVLDDAETIARQARRRAATQRRRREALQIAGVASLILAVGALMSGVPVLVVAGTLILLGLVLGLAHRQVRDRQQTLRRRRVRAAPGQGIGTPRPKGGFSTTRHRSGAPVWVRHPLDDRAA